MNDCATTHYNARQLTEEARSEMAIVNRGLPRQDKRKFDHWDLVVTNHAAFLHVYYRDRCGNLCQSNVAL